jgi:tRNA(Ile)-lysidine synthase
MRNPTDLARRVLAFADEQDLLPAGSHILCALSGGTDSMALAALLLELAPLRRLTLTAAHYNHGLRGEEAQRDEDFVSRWCQRQGLPLVIGRGDVASQAQADGRGIEETARTMRYAFLTQAAQEAGAEAIATAHNADDNVETILLHLIRGAGLEGLTGIPPRRGTLIRPLLPIPRRDLEGYLAAQGIPHVEDSSNQDPAYTRNRLRQEVLPVLRDLNPNLAATIAGNLPHLRADRDLLHDLARETAQSATPRGDGLVLSARKLTSLPRPVAVRAVRQILARLGCFQVAAHHLDGILDLAWGNDPGGEVPLPQGWRLRRQYDDLCFGRSDPDEGRFAPVSVAGPGRYPLQNGWVVTLTPGLCPQHPPQGAWDCCLRWEAPVPLVLRPRQTGDTLRLPGRREKSLKKWYIDEKIPRQRRDALPVLAAEQGVWAAAGLGPQEGLLARPGCPALRVTFTPPEKKNERTSDAERT